MGCEPHDDHARRRVDVDTLSVDATRRERSVWIVRHPPHVPVTPSRQRLVTGLRKERAVATPPDVGNHRFRDDLLAVEPSLQPHHLAEPREIAEREIQTTASELDPC